MSYDSPEALREFSEARGLGFPLLSDLGSTVITRLGLLDRDLEAHQGAFGIETRDTQQGVAYPAVFVLDESGVVIQKRIQETYRAREGARWLMEAAFGIASPAPAAAVSSTGSRVRVRAATDSEGYVRWEKSRLHVTLAVEGGWHVYAAPVPDGYTGLSVELGPVDGVSAGDPMIRAGRPFRVEGLDEEFQVLEGEIQIVVPFAANVAPDRGTLTLPVRVRYQACSATECEPPATIGLDVVLEQIPGA